MIEPIFGRTVQKIKRTRKKQGEEKRAFLAYKSEPFILCSANHLQANPEMELKLKAAIKLYLAILILEI